MLYECHVSCRTMDPMDEETLGIEDPLKWLPFVIDISNVYAIKLTTDVVSDMAYNCTTLFTYDGETYVIDTLFADFSRIFIDYKNNKYGTNTRPNGPEQGTDLELS